MSMDEILQRLDRIYASIDTADEGDLTKFVPVVIQNKEGYGIYQDFRGGLNDAELSNLAYSVIHNIANFRAYLDRWAEHNGCKKAQIEEVFSSSLPLHFITDLSIYKNHPYPPRKGGHSRKSPRLGEVKRILRLTTGVGSGSGIAITLTPQGPRQVGTGSTNVIVTAQVLDSKGTIIGDLYKLELEALEAWEQELRDLKLLT